MRVRCSTGLDVASYSGHFYRMPANPTDVYLPAIDADKALLANIVHTEKLLPGSECYVQVGMRCGVEGVVCWGGVPCVSGCSAAGFCVPERVPSVCACPPCLASVPREWGRD